MAYRLNRSEREAMAERLEAARYMAGLSIRGVAAELGVHTASVTQWESGSVPVPETRARLAELYGIEEDVLFPELAARRKAAEALLRPTV